VTSSELEILRAIQREGGVAGVTALSVACDLTSGYVDYLCRYLKRGGYLSLAGRPGVYQLTPRGEAAVGKTTLELGRYLETQERSEIARALDRILTSLHELQRPDRPMTRRIWEEEGTAGAMSRLERTRPDEQIVAKTAFIDPLEGTDAEMEASFDEIGTLEETASDIAEAIAVLRQLKAGTEEDEQEN